MLKIYFLFLMLFSNKALANNNSLQLLLATSYAAENSWSLAILDSTIKHLKQSGLELKYSVYHLESDSPKKILSQIHKEKPGIVVLFDDEVANAIIHKIPTSIPVVVSGINQPKQNISWLSRKNMSAISEEFSIEPILSSLTMMNIKLKNWLVIGPENYSSKLVAKSLHFQSKKSAIETKILLSNSFNDWKNSIDEINNMDAAWVLLPFGVVSDDNSPMSTASLVEKFSKNIKVPTFGPGNALKPIPRMITMSSNPNNLGKQTAEHVFRFFKGEELEKIGYEKLKYQGLQVNFNEGKRIGLNIPRKLFDFVQ